MRRDIFKVITERERRGSSERSLKTAKRLNCNIDFDDADCGSSRASSSRRVQYGCNAKTKNRSSRPMTQFLKKAVGRVWDDVYSEICTIADSRSVIGRMIRSDLRWMLELHPFMVDGVPFSNRWRWHEVTGLYVNAAGVLCFNPKKKILKKVEPVTSIHRNGNVWYELETLKTVASCKCVHFKVPRGDDKRGLTWRYNNSSPAVCIHGNEPIERPIWYVVEYGYHQPDDVYKVYTYNHCYPGRNERYNLNAPGDKHHIYYRDVPEKLAEAFVVTKKVANRKDLKAIAKLIKGDGRGW